MRLPDLLGNRRAAVARRTHMVLAAGGRPIESDEPATAMPVTAVIPARAVIPVAAAIPVTETTGGGWVLDAQFDRILSSPPQRPDDVALSSTPKRPDDDDAGSHDPPGHRWWYRSAGADRWALPRVRLDPGRRTAAAVGVAALLAAVLAGGWLFVDRARVGAVVARGAGVTSSLASGSTAGSAATPSITSAKSATAAGPAASGRLAQSTQLVVDVVGLVVRPGVYQLAVGSRVADALAAAGGPLPGVNLTTVNLARRLVDGEQIAIGVPAATDAAGDGVGDGAGGAAAGQTGGATQPLVDLNTATLEQLDALPGVGPVLAQRILDWRNSHGRFDSVDQLRQVSGIGAAKFADVRSLVTV